MHEPPWLRANSVAAEMMSSPDEAMKEANAQGIGGVDSLALTTLTLHARDEDSPRKCRIEFHNP